MTALEYLQAMSDTEFQSYVNWFTPEDEGWECWGVCKTEYGPITSQMVTDEIHRRTHAELEMLGLGL